MKGPLSVLVVVAALLPQILLGGLRSGVALCLGGGHEHRSVEVVTDCQSECAHSSDAPVRLTSEEHAEPCGCTDVTLRELDLLPVLRERSGQADGEDIALVPTLAAWTGPPDARSAPGRAGPASAAQWIVSSIELLHVRSTRLII